MRNRMHAGLPPGASAEQEADHGQARLHDEAAFVGRLPLGEQGAIVELQPCRLLGEIDIERRAREQCRDDQCEKPDKHACASL